MTSINGTVSRQNLWAGNITKSMTSEGNIALLPADVYRRLPLQGLMNFQLQNFQLYNKSLKDRSVGRQLILIPENINVTRGTLRFSGNKINCLPTDQSLSVYRERFEPRSHSKSRLSLTARVNVVLNRTVVVVDSDYSNSPIQDYVHPNDQTQPTF